MPQAMMLVDNVTGNGAAIAVLALKDADGSARVQANYLSNGTDIGVLGIGDSNNSCLHLKDVLGNSNIKNMFY
jgi:hypothetical protein